MDGRSRMSLGAAAWALTMIAAPSVASPPTASSSAASSGASSPAAASSNTAPSANASSAASLPTGPAPGHTPSDDPARPGAAHPPKRSLLASLFSRPTRKSLLDVDGNGKVTFADLLALAGVKDHVDRICGLTPDNRLAFGSPYRLSGEVLLDLAEHGKVDLKDPMHLLGLDSLDHNTRRLSLRSDGVMYEARWLF